MATVSLLVFGGDGQLGSAIAEQAAARGLACVALGRAHADVRDAAAVAESLRRHAPRAVINCAAFTNVDAAETDPEAAFAVNARAAENIAKACAAARMRLVHASTSYVFDGGKPSPYVETDLPAPLGVYGASKLVGEALVHRAHPEATVVRLIALFGRRGARSKEAGNFVEAFMQRLRRDGEVQAVADQWITPTHAPDAAAALLCLVDSAAGPVVHVANQGRASWYDVACRVEAGLGLQGRVRPVPSTAWPYRSPRPVNACLDTTRYDRLAKAPLRSWEQAVDAYVRERTSV